MIKKAVLLTSLTPFLMVFSDYSFAKEYDNGWYDSSWRPVNGCLSKVSYSQATACIPSEPSHGVVYGVWVHKDIYDRDKNLFTLMSKSFPDYAASVLNEYDLYHVQYSPWKCNHRYGGKQFVDTASLNAISSGGSVSLGGGGCGVSGYSVDSPLNDCGEQDGVYGCSVTLDFDTYGFTTPQGDELGSFGTFSVIEFNSPDYLNELPGGCSDNSSCVKIGDQSFLVDWDSAPDHFEYVGSDGKTYSKPSSGGGSGGDNGGDTGGGDPTDPTDPTDPGGNDGGDSGGDSGGSDGGNDSGDGSGGSSGGGGGSTVPEFEFDESGIIEAIGSAGRSNRDAINALSNDVTSSISNQTNELNNATSTQTDALSGALTTQTDTITNSLDTQTDSVTSALDDQTGTLTGSLDALGTSIVDAINAFGSGEGEGDGEGAEGDGLLDGISNLFNGLVDDLASRFTEDLGDGDDLFNSSGLDNTLDGVAAEEQQYSDEINTLMDEIGDGATSGIAEQVTSRLPSLPSGGCSPLQFGPMEISCQAFNTIKLWLTWIIYFWTVVSIVDIFFRSEQRTA